MECLILVILLASQSPLPGGTTGGSPVRDSNLAPAAPAGDEPAPVVADLDAHQAVRQGNRRLIEGNPTDALEAYRHAEGLQPDAREIAFVRGLAHYELDELDQAREAFQRAATSTNNSLADDALYSLSTCDHAEALESLDNPELALSMLESAMRRYQNVLANRPDHKAARDANLKAASMWRELKEQLQQQQDQQQDSEQSNEDSEDQQPQEQDDSEQQQDSQPDQSQDQDQQQESQQQPDPNDQAEEQQEQQDSKAEQQERVSREQAERKLREMMQAIRERKKVRREAVQTIPVAPVDKDW